MREVLEQILSWQRDSKQIAIATNVRKDGSSLRPLGSKMAVTAPTKLAKAKATPEIAGSVTGGCIEGVVYEQAQEVLKSGKPKLLRYGVVEEDRPWEIGLTCGSSLEVFVESLESPEWQQLFPELVRSLEKNEKVALATIIDGDDAGKKILIWPDGKYESALGQQTDVQKVIEKANEYLTAEVSDWAMVDGQSYFFDVLPPPARLIVIGAVHIAIPLVRLAKTLGFKTIIVDPREAFATKERFPETIVDELLIEWPSDALERLRPDEGTYIAALSHDEKLDNPALVVALNSPARYVGVLGTRRKIPDRKAALQKMGVSPEKLEKLHAPIGINLKAVSPEEIALSILSEMIATRHGMG